MNIKVTDLTVSEKSINTWIWIPYDFHDAVQDISKNKNI